MRRHRRLYSRAFIVANFFFLFAVFYTLSSSSLYYHRYLHRSSVTNNLVATSRLVALVSSGWGLDHLLDIPSAALNLKSVTALDSLLESVNRNRDWSERVVITPFMVLKKPDVNTMKLLLHCPTSSNCTLLLKPLLDEKDDRPTVEMLKSLFKAGYIHPELGGQIGFNARHWMRELEQAGASWMENLQSSPHANFLAWKCFMEGRVCSAEVDQEINEFLYFETESLLMDWMRNASNAFYEWWKYYPSILGLHDDTLGPSLIDICRQLGYRGIHVISMATPWRIYRNVDQRMSILNDIVLPTAESVCKQWCMENLDKLLYDSGEYLSIRIPPSLLFNDTTMSGNSCFHFLVHKLEEKEDTLFLTSSELHQILSVGWSMEIWDGYLVLRNFLEETVTVSILHIDSFNSAWNERKKPILEMLCDGYQNISQPQVKLVEMSPSKRKEKSQDATIYDCRDNLQLQSGKSYLLFPMST